MKIDVLSAQMAERFVPKVPTLAMRMFGSRNFQGHDYFSLVKSDSYIVECRYTFDDLDPNLNDEDELLEHGAILFDEKIAAGILDDFERYRERVEGLMVHCYAGLSRSPATAIALNEIYGLGDDSLMKNYGISFNPFVYQTLIDLAKKRRVS